MRDSSVVTSLTGSSSKVYGGRRKGGRNLTTVDRIKNLVTDYGGPTHQILTIKSILKGSIYSEQSDQVDIINTKQYSPTIIDIVNKIEKLNDDIVTCDVNTRRRVRARRRLISLGVLNNQNKMIKLAKVKVNFVNCGRIRDDKNNFVA